MTTTTKSASPVLARTGTGVLARLSGAALCLAVTVIHIDDQGGLTALKTPAYVGHGYWALEVAAVVAAALVLARLSAGWLLAAGVAAGPMVGYVLSRGPGLPNYTDDRGNWAEPLGEIALVVEAVLLLLALAQLRRARSR